MTIEIKVHVLRHKLLLRNPIEELERLKFHIRAYLLTNIVLKLLHVIQRVALSLTICSHDSIKLHNYLKIFEELLDEHVLLLISLFIIEKPHE